MPQLQRARRRDPHPFTWEIPLAVLVGVLLVGVFGVHLGRALANTLAGGAWQMPAREDLFTGLAGVLAGDAAAGLDAATLVAGRTADPSLLWACIAAVEVVLLAGVIVAVKAGLDRWGPGRIRGMASPVEAERLLGLTRLRRAAPIIRPDLHRSTPQRRQRQRHQRRRDHETPGNGHLPAGSAPAVQEPRL